MELRVQGAAAYQLKEPLSMDRPERQVVLMVVSRCVDNRKIPLLARN
jgi:hypothetical protein